MILSDNPELIELLSAVPGAWTASRTDSEAAAARVEAIIDTGVGSSYERSAAGFGAVEAARSFARVLDDATGDREL